jgi:Fe2+ transport system protein B
MRRKYQEQFNQNSHTSNYGQDDHRQRIYEEVYRKQHEYEQKMRNNWFDSNRNVEEVTNHREQLLFRNMLAFSYFILMMSIFFSLVFKIDSAPEEVIIVDPVTGKRRVITYAQFKELERRANEESRNYALERERMRNAGPRRDDR